MTVLVSYVPTSAGLLALDEAIAQAMFRKTPVVVVNVGMPGKYADVTFAEEQHLDAVTERLKGAGVEFEIRQVIDALDVADAVLALAEEVAAELIVLALRRRSRVGKMLLGSNAQQIILSASCPVLSVREPE